MTAKSPLAVQNVFSAVQNNLSVLFIAENDVFAEETFLVRLDNLRPPREKLKLARMSECEQEQLETNMNLIGTKSVYAIFEESDFTEPVSPRRIGQILACFVSLLEIVARNRTFELYLHLHFNADRSNEKAIPVTTAKCLDKLNGPRFQDVMFKSIYLYATTYQRLYNIPVRMYVS